MMNIAWSNDATRSILLSITVVWKPCGSVMRHWVRFSIFGSKNSMILLARMRSEMGGTGMGMTNITQCDLRRTIIFNDQTRTYMITPLDASGDVTNGAARRPADYLTLAQFRMDGQAVFHQVARHLGEGMPAREIAVLYRTNGQADLVEEGLRERRAHVRL